MKEFRIEEGGLAAGFRVRENGTVELAHFTPAGSGPVREEIPPSGAYYPLLEVEETGKSSRNLRGSRHNACSASLEFRYLSHRVTDEADGRLLVLELETEPGLHAAYQMRFFSGVPAVQVFVTLENRGTEDVPLEHVSAFLFRNLCGEGELPYYEKTEIFVPRNSWYTEGRWQAFDARDLLLNGLPVTGHNCPGQGRNRFAYGSTSSWSSSDYLPMGFVRDREREETYFFQIEHSGQWLAEYGSDPEGKLYLSLSGASEQEHGWWKMLHPGERWSTVPAAFGVVKGGINEAAAALTRYRRQIRRFPADAGKPAVIFNDYMNCLMGEPREETVRETIRLAAELGCEYYCMDAGWYDDGYWWGRVGAWEESTARFPGGLRKLFDYARSLGLKMGLWLEIEVMGTKCALAQELPDDWFVCRHGRRHIDNGRYLLDFRNPEVRAYTRSVLERLIRDYGCEYFKMDYNVTMGTGSGLLADSGAEAIRQHYECLYGWYADLLRSYPQLLIENCGSGGMRMDYGILKYLALQSVSDQTDALWNAFIGADAAAAVLPEQAGMWVYPYEDDREHVIFNMTAGLLLRPYMSGRVWELSEEHFRLLREGVAFYKAHREEFARAVPVFPLGFSNVRTDRYTAFGLRSGKRLYLSVLAPFADAAEIPLPGTGEGARASVLYPETGDCDYQLEQETLFVRMPGKACGRLFLIEAEGD